MSTDFSTWSFSRLIAQRQHLESILLVSVGQNDPETPAMRAELKAVREEVASRAAKEAAK